MGVERRGVTDLKSLPKEENNLTKQEEFHPTPHMIVWLDTALQLMTDNISEIERESKITAQSWYNWIKDDGFRLWYRAEWDKRIAMVGPQLDAIGMRQAKRDPKVLELMMKRVGTLTESPKTLQQFNVGGKDGNTITFVNFKHESES